MKGRTPFGYEIIGGKAYVNEGEAEQLKTYFRLFLEGEAMSVAARKAGLSFTSRTYPRLFKRKEYIGTDYYPAIISSDYQKQLIDEWEKRKGDLLFNPRRRAKKRVRVYSDFVLMPEEKNNEKDPVSALYERICPKQETEHMAPER